MNVLDIIITIPLLFGAYKGFTRGLIIEIASIIGLIAGIYCGVYFSEYAAGLIRQHFNLEGTMLQFASFTVTFLAVVIGVHLLGKILEKVAGLVALKLINKLFGAGFGLLKWAVIVSVLVVVVEAVDSKFGFIPKENKAKSILYEPISSITPLIIPAITDAVWFINQLEEEYLNTGI